MPVDQDTFNYLKGLWGDAGGDPGHADVAAAIAFAESTGCPYALAGPRDIRPVKECTWNVTSGENSCGYWQINLYAHPQYAAPSIFDPSANAKAAVRISGNGRDFGPWSTYTNRAYLPFLEQYGGQAPAGGGSGNGGTGSNVVPGNLGSVRGWGELTKTLARGLPAELAHSQRVGRLTRNRLAARRRRA